MVSSLFRRNWRSYLQRCPKIFKMEFSCTKLQAICIDKQEERCYSTASTTRDGNENTSLAKSLASLIEESSYSKEKKTLSRLGLKRLIELRIKKRVKQQYINGKFHNLLEKVIAIPRTLQDAYDSIRINSNIDLASKKDDICFDSIAQMLYHGNFDISSNTLLLSSRGMEKEVLVLPNINLKVVQEAIRFVLEIVHRPHFSKISHGCRSGRGHYSALKYIRDQVRCPNWWFSLRIKKKIDGIVFSKLIATMEDKIDDPGLFALIQSMFDACALNLEFGGFPKGHGLPQEGVLSPILMNIYLDLFDGEFHRLAMKFEASSHVDEDMSKSNLRKYFRRQVKGSSSRMSVEELNAGFRVHCCRFMDDVFISVSGSKCDAIQFKTEIHNYLVNSLFMEADAETEILPCDGPKGVRFLGAYIRRRTKETPAVRAVHKLREKVGLFASQKEEAWKIGTGRMGKKWLAHGLKKVKESEIKHLADGGSVLSKISYLRKSGMETEHWYQHLMKIWMQAIKAKRAYSEKAILQKYVIEPSLPEELTESFYKFQKKAKDYVTNEMASMLSLLPDLGGSTKSSNVTEIIAPIEVIKKRLLRYGLINRGGQPCSCRMLILHDTVHIIDWFAGIIRRWGRWYCEFDNFDEIKSLMSFQVRLSCIRTLAGKFRLHEDKVKVKFESELSRIPCSEDVGEEVVCELLDSVSCSSNEALTYGISDSGLCFLSLEGMGSCACSVMGCLALATGVYRLHVMERQKFPGWKTGFLGCIHPSLNKCTIWLCKQHLSDLYLSHISLQSIEFGPELNDTCNTIV